MSNRIACQDERHTEDNGCPTCGGYGYVLGPTRCSKCSRTGLVSPGNRTCYKGKQFRTIDGVGFIYTDISGESLKILCVQCFEDSSK